MTKIKSLLFALLFVFVGNAVAQQIQPLPLDPKVRYGTLENGLTYYIRHNEEPKNRAEFHIAQNVGAILEEDHQNGLAHFLEHMAFNGTKNFPGKTIINYFEEQGVKFGYDINAYTSLDETVYRLSNVPTTRQNLLDSALLVLHDWSGFLLLEHQEIDDERGVILEEWRTGNTAQRRLMTKSTELRYPGSQYAKRDVIGDTAIIKNFEYDALKAYYHKWYRPDQQAIVIVGDVDVDLMENKIKEMFADIPRAENFGERPLYYIDDNVEPIIAIVTDKEAPQTTLRIDYKRDVLPKELSLSMIGYANNLLMNLINSILNERYDDITTKADAPFVAAYTLDGDIVKTKRAFINLIIPKEGQELAGFEAMMLELEKLKRYGVTNSELDRAKTNLLKNYEKAYNERDNQKSQALANEYIRHYLDGEPATGIEAEYELAQMLLPQINADAINQTLKALLVDENVIVTVNAPIKESVVVPTEEQLLAVLENVKTAELTAKEEEGEIRPLISKLPKAGKIKSIVENSDLETVEMTLKNGIKLVFKPTTFKKDEILMSAYSDGGFSKITEIADLPTAELTTAIVANNGIGDFSATELSKVLTGKIASVQPTISRYQEGMRGSSSVADLETMLQLTYLYFTQPRKDDDAFNALLTMYKTALANVDKNPDKIFSDSISMTNSGNDPRIVLQNAELADKLDQDKAIEIYKERFANPADFTFLFVGNIDPYNKETQKLLATYLGGLKTKKKKLETWDDVYKPTPKGIVMNNFQQEMETPKASNRIQYTADMPYNIDNSLNVNVIGSILNIRYLESIREKEGGTYGVGVRGHMIDRPNEQAVLMMQFDTDPKKQERLLEIIHQEVKDIVNDGPLAEDLQKVKENMQKQYVQDLEQNNWWMGALSSYYEDGINRYRDYEAALKAVTAKSVQETLKKIVEQGNVIEVIMLPEE